MSSTVDTREAKLISATNDFAFDLIRSNSRKENLFISPLSISTALAMVYLGSDGTTAKVLREVLKYEEHDLSDTDIHQLFQTVLNRTAQSHDGFQLSMFNGAVVQKEGPILGSYEQQLKQYYDAVLEKVDFVRGAEEARLKINTAVEKATRGKIVNFLEEPPTKETRLLLVNAVYFLGNWEHQFDENMTREGTFYNNGVQEKTVQMMVREGHYGWGTIEELEASAVVLPYGGVKSGRMVIFVPKSRTGVDRLAQKITGDVVKTTVQGLLPEKINLSLPRFSLNCSLNLEEPLKDLGLGELFSDGANLSRMAEAELRVNSALHKAVIEVNEKGCEAAAATGISCGITCLPPQVTVEHPFLFFILEEQSGAILFTGRVYEL